jgi:riboflavin-specific deaminase-like protein
VGHGASLPPGRRSGALLYRRPVRRVWPDPAEIDDVGAFVAAAERPTPAGRPWLLVNMITSLDGAITVDGRSGGLGRPADKVMFSALRAIGDVVLAGAGTVRAEQYGPPRPSTATRAARQGRGQAPAPRLAIVSRSLELDPGAALFTDADEPAIVITCESSPADGRAALGAVAEVIVAGGDAVDLRAAMRALHERGVSTVCCEGGPRLNGDLLEADLVDEWALTISPLLVGGDADRAVVGGEPSSPRPMRVDWLVEGDGLILTRWVRDA